MDSSLPDFNVRGGTLWYQFQMMLMRKDWIGAVGCMRALASRMPDEKDENGTPKYRTWESTEDFERMRAVRYEITCPLCTEKSEFGAWESAVYLAPRRSGQSSYTGIRCPNEKCKHVLRREHVTKYVLRTDPSLTDVVVCVPTEPNPQQYQHDEEYDNAMYRWLMLYQQTVSACEAQWRRDYTEAGREPEGEEGAEPDSGVEL